MMLFRKRKPEGKSAWSVVPAGDVPALAAALSSVVENAKFSGVDPAEIRMGRIRKSVDWKGDPVWRLSFSISEKAWRLRGYPADQVSAGELHSMTAEEITAAYHEGRLKSLLI